MERKPLQGNSGSAPIGFLLSAQRALWGAVSPSWRQVSLSVDEATREYRLRFVFTEDATDDEIEDAQAAATEINADFPDWIPSEEFQKWDPPQRPKPGPRSFRTYGRLAS
jgi:hypothetical protein